MGERAMGTARPTWAISALALALTSCGGDDHCGDCFAPPPYPAAEVSFALVAGDFNNNGFSSIVQTSTVMNGLAPEPGYLKAYLSAGAGAFAAPVLTSAGDNPLYLASADLNGDHLPDIVSASAQDGTLSVFFNNAQSPGTFNTPLVLSSPGASQLVIADMNGDGLPDLISADFNVSLFLQTSPGTFANPISLYPGGANWVAVGDLNGDGTPDVALTDNTGVKVLLHTGAAAATTFAAPVTVYTEAATAGFAGANLIAIADVNGDGLNDLIITDPGPADGSAPIVAVLLQNSASPGTFLPAVNYAIAASSFPQSIVVADVNADGHPDIIVGGSAAVSVLLQDAATPGTFLAASNYPVTNANEIAIADVNADGRLDIVVTTGPALPKQNGVIPNQPGVLLQSATTAGTFGALQALP
jgi:VCBS repeat protein